MYTAELIYKGEKLFVKDFPSENKGPIGIAVRFCNECNANIALRRKLLTGNGTVKLFYNSELIYQIELQNLNPKK